MSLPFFLFDIGATHSRIGMSFDGEHIEREQMFPTPQSFEEGVSLLEQKAKEISDGQIGLSVGGLAGPLDRQKTGVIGAPNLPDWNGKPFAQELGKRLGSEVLLENDTAMVGLGEASYGAGRGFPVVAYMTISTGVNGVRVVDGKIDTNNLGFEIGSQIVDFDGSYESAAEDFEDLVSGASFERRFGMPAHEISDPNIWAEIARLSSLGIANMIFFWSPHVVVLGGSVSKSIPVNILVDQIHARVKVFPELPEIKIAELGDFGGLWGALCYAKSSKD